MLSRMLDLDTDIRLTVCSPHGTVRLVPDTKKVHVPTIYADFELQFKPHSATKSAAHTSTWNTRPLNWVEDGESNTVTVAETLVSNVIGPLSNVVCYFASDLHGVEGVSALLARQAVTLTAHKTPRAASAHILIVIDTKSKRFDTFDTQQKLHNSIKQLMKKDKEYNDDDDVEQDLRATFHSIQVLGLQRCWNLDVSAGLLRQRLLSLSKQVYRDRMTSRHLFTAAHLDALSSRMLGNLCKGKSPFNFLRLSRPEGFAYQEDLYIHLVELLTLIPNESWLWKLVVPIVSSALILASYPPGSHCKLFSVLIK